MVHLILSSTKGMFLLLSLILSSYFNTGNQGLRYFPYTGYLGLTPIRVEGGMFSFSVFTARIYILLLSCPDAPRCRPKRPQCKVHNHFCALL